MRSSREKSRLFPVQDGRHGCGEEEGVERGQCRVDDGQESTVFGTAQADEGTGQGEQVYGNSDLETVHQPYIFYVCEG